MFRKLIFVIIILMLQPKTMNNGIENNSEIPLHTNVKVVTEKVTLFYLLHQCFGWQFYTVGILKFIADCSSFMGPILLNKLIGFIEDKNEPISHGYLYASLLILSAIIGIKLNFLKFLKYLPHKSR